MNPLIRFVSLCSCKAVFLPLILLNSRSTSPFQRYACLGYTIAFSASVAAQSMKASRTLNGHAAAFYGGEIPFGQRTNCEDTQDVRRTTRFTMKIREYIAQRQLEPLDPNSMTRPLATPSSLAARFNASDDVEYYSNADRSRWVGICRARNFFAACRPGAVVTNGSLDETCPTLRSL
jgi:hypothetical protein